MRMWGATLCSWSGASGASRQGVARAERQPVGPRMGLHVDHCKGCFQLGKHKPGQVEGLPRLAIC